MAVRLENVLGLRHSFGKFCFGSQRYGTGAVTGKYEISEMSV